jgi:hypothetical protein
VKNFNENSSTVAYATACAINGGTNRPNIGMIAINEHNLEIA